MVVLSYGLWLIMKKKVMMFWFEWLYLWWYCRVDWCVVSDGRMKERWMILKNVYGASIRWTRLVMKYGDTFWWLRKNMVRIIYVCCIIRRWSWMKRRWWRKKKKKWYKSWFDIKEKTQWDGFIFVWRNGYKIEMQWWFFYCNFVAPQSSHFS